MAAQTDDFYGGGFGAPSMSWDDKHNRGCFINQWRGGLIISVRKKQATNAKDGEPKFWPDGNGGVTDRPIQCLVITVLTDERDPQNPVDDGLRTIYIDQENTKYSKRNKRFSGQEKPGTKYGAHCDAMKAAGSPRQLPEPAGYYYLCQTGAVQGDGDIPRKTWLANYQVPSPEGLAALDAYVAKSGQGDSFGEDNSNEQQGPFVNNGQQGGPPPAPPQGGQASASPGQQQPAPPAPPQGGQANGQQQPHWNGGQGQQAQQQPPAPPSGPPAPPAGTAPGQTPSYAGAPAASNQPQWGPSGDPQEQYAPQGHQQFAGTHSAAQHGPAQGTPPQGWTPEGPPAATQPVLLGYDANGQPIYGQPVQQPQANGNGQNQYAYQGAPPQQPTAPVGANPYAQ